MGWAPSSWPDSQEAVQGSATQQQTTCSLDHVRVQRCHCQAVVAAQAVTSYSCWLADDLLNESCQLV